jgi:acyl-coenzyme A thioesterase PaaI-like protein
MHFSMAGDRTTAVFTIPDYLQGFPGQAHGGAVATMLDEAMGWACYGQGILAMTAKFTMRFRDSVPLGESLAVSAWVTRDRGRFIQLEAECRTSGGILLAEAEGMFARIQGKQAETLRRNYEAATSG